MNFKKYIVLCLSVLVLACTDRPISESVNIPTPPAKTQSVRPQLATVQTNIDKTIVDNAKISETLKNQTKQLLDQKAQIVEAILMSEKFKETAKAKQLISELDAMALNAKLLSIQGSNKELEIQNQELVKKLAETSALLEATKAEAQKTMESLILAEGELSTLRGQNGFLASNLTSRNQDVEALQKKNASLEKKAASASVYKNWIIGLAAGFILWTILKNILMIYFPATRFRI